MSLHISKDTKDNRPQFYAVKQVPCYKENVSREFWVTFREGEKPASQLNYPQSWTEGDCAATQKRVASTPWKCTCSTQLAEQFLSMLGPQRGLGVGTEEGIYTLTYYMQHLLHEREAMK
jgi:hypothetical protein